MRLVCNEEMRKIENEAYDSYGLSEELIIENVGHEGARYVYEDFLSQKQFKEVLVFVGKGNNGADGVALSRHLLYYFDSVRIFLLFPESECSPVLNKFLKMSKACGVKCTEISNAEQVSSYFSQSTGKALIIDAIFGTGIRGPLSNFIFDLVKVINHWSKDILSIDIPTGVSGDNGLVENTAIRAKRTYAIGAPKIGLYFAEGYKFSGLVRVLKAGFPQKLVLTGDKILLGPSGVVEALKLRDQYAHKNMFGKSLIIGGTEGLTGALILAAMGSLRVGTGKVTAITWEDNYLELVSRLIPEIMTGKIPREENEEEVGEGISQLQNFDAIVIGPGLGQGKRARRLVREVVQNYAGIIILDADALNCLSYPEDKITFQGRLSPTLLTPHVGEFAHFMKSTPEEVLQDPVRYLKKVVEEFQCSVLLKGPCSYLALTNGKIYVNYFPNDGLATGGSGDVLAGIIGGLASQQRNNLGKERADEVKSQDLYTHFYNSAKLGLVLHSLAGKKAAEHLGTRAMSAGSITDFLPEAFKELKTVREEAWNKSL